MTTPASKILLGVNVDHCATVRQARFREHALDHGNEVEPDPVAFALLCEKAGADAESVTAARSAGRAFERMVEIHSADREMGAP